VSLHCQNTHWVDGATPGKVVRIFALNKNKMLKYISQNVKNVNTGKVGNITHLVLSSCFNLWKFLF
jgi:hypothetical protein